MTAVITSILEDQHLRGNRLHRRAISGDQEDGRCVDRNEKKE
ncbi:hypothetical protein [Bacillus piscicola]|nr:hypothetical protein [Bacillus piscicola]